ncbi:MULTISPECIES: hypothetical protein [Planktothrix]|jgi:hypothetical protein|uniref:Uncharacterized protein n=2 Tax=Planktothrix TaxID=54304 RepID=A0A4V0XV42_PLAAG|nr:MULTISPECIES: hypothetical protein [Planktothrix]CAH2572817.1 hypothetical protein PRNO82_02225 [Planktothrix rubescens]CAC5340128.1 conserved hypothetical protein [Planktothrix rubescens NIVA-CYA 18]CAD0225927.1 conserved hypothetical protein [Planktothrix agardhii]CAD5946864.1 hypothetical protein PCC7821_02271 [Planktothrix rubescens NIVA-CYA 18]CAD5948425.1 hypothetical protein NO758_02376 [Planktothrix agardhii]
MLIEEYFEFLADDDIRVKGTRVGIESILYYLTNKEATNKYNEYQDQIIHLPIAILNRL